MYKQTVDVLADENETTLLLVSRPESNPLKEAARASEELFNLGIRNQQIIMNGLFVSNEVNDAYTKAIVERQTQAIATMPTILHKYPLYSLPLAPFSITSIEKMHAWFTGEQEMVKEIQVPSETIHTSTIHQLVEEYMAKPKRVIFMMGKGGVGKTTVATLIALGLAGNGQKVHLTTTDPAAHIGWVLGEEVPNTLTMSSIDPEQVLADYKEEVLSKARETMNEEGLFFVQEDLESPCTEEIAVFRAFANIIEEHHNEIVVIDTAPTGHTLLLLDASEAYHKEINRSSGEVPISIQHLLPTLRNPNETSVVITTLPEATPVYEAERLQQDLERAGLTVEWWVINKTFSGVQTNHPLLKRKVSSEIKWIKRVNELSNKNTVCIPWSLKEPKGLEGLNYLLSEGK